MHGLVALLSTALAAQTVTPKPQTTTTTVSKPAANSKQQTTAKPAVKPAAPRRPAAKAPVKPTPTAPTPMTDDQKTIYALGLSMFDSLAQFNLSPAELDLVKQALSDAAAGKRAVDLSTWGPKIQPLARARTVQAAARRKAESEEFLAKAAAEPGTVKTDSGLIYKELQPGTGASPKATDTVKVNYRGTFIDGTEFDSSYKRNEPAQFPLNGVIRCWTEGVQKMKVGGKAKLVCPSEIAYGDGGRPSIPGGSTLVFEIELLDVVGASGQN
jgi:FKBP-type peptidyl-prolyl cis-trans isomerase FkpA